MWLSSILAQNWSLSKSKLDLWKPGLNKRNERETQPKITSPFSLIFFAKVVARQTKGKMIVDGVNIASVNCLDETQSAIHLCDPTHRGVTRQEITVFSLLSKVYRCQ